MERLPAVIDQEELDMVMLGSGVLLRSLLPARLVEELILLIHPLALGSGQRLFSDSHRLEFDLVDAQTTSTGVIMATYRPA